MVFSATAASVSLFGGRGEGVSQLRWWAPSGVMQSRSLSLSHFLKSHFTTSRERIRLCAAAAAAAAALPFGSFFPPCLSRRAIRITYYLDSPSGPE